MSVERGVLRQERVELVGVAAIVLSEAGDGLVLGLELFLQPLLVLDRLDLKT